MSGHPFVCLWVFSLSVDEEKRKIAFTERMLFGCENYNGKPILQMADAFHSYFFAEIVLEFYRWVRKKRIEDVLSRPFSIL